MERLTSDKPVSEMNMVELAHNCCYADKYMNARFRDFENDIDARELTRYLMHMHDEWDINHEAMVSDEIFDICMHDDLSFEIDDIVGFIARFYQHLWAMADLRERLKHYEDLEEQGLLLKLPISIENAVDKLFSHNEIISLWKEARENGISVHKRIWYGMAWDIPEELKNCKFVKIFGTIPESIAHADIINIEVLLSEEAEKALAEMEK